RVRPGADGAAGGVVEDRELVEGRAAPVDRRAVLDRDLYRADGARAAGVRRGARQVGRQRGGVVRVAIDGRRRDRGGRVVGVDDDVLLAADRARATHGGQRERRVVGRNVLDRAARESKRVRCRVIQVGGVVAGAGGVVEGQHGGAAAGVVGGGAAAVQRERRAARNVHDLAEGDRDGNQGAGRIGAVRLGGGHVGDGGCGRV